MQGVIKKTATEKGNAPYESMQGMMLIGQTEQSEALRAFLKSV
jgi:hypothetical protein